MIKTALKTYKVLGLRIPSDKLKERNLMFYTRIVELEVVLDYGYEDKLVVDFGRCGVTGHESFCLKDIQTTRIKIDSEVVRVPWEDPRVRHGMSLCAGTVGRWDQLLIPKDNFIELLKEIRGDLDD